MESSDSDFQWLSGIALLVVHGHAVHFGDNGFWCNPRQSQLQDTKATLSWALSGKSGAERERERNPSRESQFFISKNLRRKKQVLFNFQKPHY